MQMTCLTRVILKLKKRLISVFALLVLGSFALLMGLRTVLISTAQQRADSFLTHIEETDAENFVYEATRAVHKVFASEAPHTSVLLRLRPFISNRRLPGWLRVPDGALETVNPSGLCGNAARMLTFVLSRRGLEAYQWNMVSSSRGHAAVVVDLPDGQRVLSDPFYGVIARDKDGQLLGPFEAQRIVRRTGRIEEALHPLFPDSELDFYEEFADVVMSAQGESLVIHTLIPTLGDKPLVLGDVNGHAHDLMSALTDRRMTPNWSYVGRKRDQGWVRHLQAVEPVNITFVLTDNPDAGVLTSNKPPAISGKSLSWDLEAHEMLIFTDGLARASISRMNSYIPVDQIVIEAR